MLGNDGCAMLAEDCVAMPSEYCVALSSLFHPAMPPLFFGGVSIVALGGPLMESPDGALPMMRAPTEPSWSLGGRSLGVHRRPLNLC